MLTGPIHPLRTTLLTLALSTLFVGLALADERSISADRLPGKDCAPALSPAALQPDLHSVALATSDPLPGHCVWYWATYDEYWKDGQICRYGDTCSGQYYGTCPNGWDSHHSEIFPCCP